MPNRSFRELVKSRRSKITPKPSQPQNPNVAASIDGEDSTKAASSSAPSNSPVTVAQRIPDSLDGGSKKHQPPAHAVQEAQVPPTVVPVTGAQSGPARAGPLAEESQPVTECTISTSQRLWNAAYDSLEKDDDTSELVRSYVNILMKVLKAEKASDPSASNDVLAELKDPNKQQMYMVQLVEEGRKKIATTSKIVKGVGDVAKFILSAKGMIDAAIQNAPQAALPWAGVCVGLQILSNPGKAIKSNLAGITHVVSRMEWYCALTEHLLDQHNIVGGFGAILHQLEDRILALYKALLLYQIKSVCSYYRNLILVVLRGLTNWDDWDGDIQDVTDAEAAVQMDSDQYNSQHTKNALGQLVKRAEEMGRLLGDIRLDIREFIEQQKRLQVDGKNKEFLRDLFVVDPQDDMDTIERKKDKLVDDAYKWIFRTKEYAAFTDWSNDESDLSQCRLLWIKGHAGTGKTMLLIGIIRELSDQSSKLAPSLSYFFCQGTGDKTLSNATAILRSLIWLLLFQQPQLISHLQSKYEYTGPSIFNDRNAFVALSAAFKSMLKDPQLSRTYLIVDALDECDQGLVELVELISSSLTLSEKVKWLVSSRPEVKLKNADTVESLVELDSQNLEDPVNAYINYKLSALKGKDGYDYATLAEVSNEIRQRSMNTFLWVALVFKELDSVDGWDALSIITRMPRGLSELYDHMMTRIEDGNTENQQRCKNVLVAALLTYRPLSLSELAILAGLLPKINPEAIVKKCGSFLTTKEDTVYLIHQSAKDYLEMNYLSKLQQGGPVQGHMDVSRRSIDAMSKLKKNIYALPYPGSKLKDITVPNPDPLEGLRYCCIYWIQHLQNSEAKRYDIDQVHEFLRSNFLHWLEALSWMGKISEGIYGVTVLESIIAGHQCLRLSEYVSDARRFLLSNRQTIEQAPLQTYCSALIFSPTTSIIREQFKDGIPEWIRQLPRVNHNWNALLQTLEGHSDHIYSVAFSPDGRMLASSSNGTVKLWDAQSGAVLQTLEGNLSNEALAFSPDCKIVALIDNKTVKLWDMQPIEALHTLEGHSDYVNDVVFSSDGRMLASASNDMTVKLWNAHSRVELQTLKVGSAVNAVAFSPDSRTLASASDASTVKIWDVSSGVVLLTLGGHSLTNPVAFSPDGKILASTSANIIKLWDAQTGAALQKLKGHSDTVHAVAFAPDSRILASASDDHTVKLWDTGLESGPALQTLEGHSSWVTDVSFSPDGRTLASASYDRTLKLWDVRSEPGAALQMLESERHSGKVAAVAFSPDGKTLASASDDKTVKLWNVRSSVLLLTISHFLSVTAVAFSPDGRILASVSDDWTVKLWDARSGVALQTLKHADKIRAIAFSPDSRILASASDNKNVVLWDTKSGVELHTLNGRSSYANAVPFSHSDYVRAVAFSPDGKTLASASNDYTVKLWDAQSGKVLQTLDGHSGFGNCKILSHSDYVRAVAFSPDSEMLAFASDDCIVKLWDARSGEMLQEIEVDDVVYTLSFSDDGSYLSTNRGRLHSELLSVKAATPSISAGDIDVKERWISYDGRDILWLPSEYAPSSVAVHKCKVAFGCPSGGVFIMEFDFRNFPDGNLLPTHV